MTNRDLTPLIKKWEDKVSIYEKKAIAAQNRGANYTPFLLNGIAQGLNGAILDIKYYLETGELPE